MPDLTVPPDAPGGVALRPPPPAYLAFFASFNAGRYFEAHEVLEALWLPERGRPDARFYQGLIQIAGAFVHFEKDRREPGVALLKLSRKHLAAYPAAHLGLDLHRVRELVNQWLSQAQGGRHNPLAAGTPTLPSPPHSL